MRAYDAGARALAEQGREYVIARGERARAEVGALADAGDARLSNWLHESVERTHVVFDAAHEKIRTTGDIGAARAKRDARARAAALDEELAQDRAALGENADALDELGKAADALRGLGAQAAHTVDARAAETSDALEAGRDPLLDSVNVIAREAYGSRSRVLDSARFFLARQAAYARDALEVAIAAFRVRRDAAVAAFDRDTADVLASVTERASVDAANTAAAAIARAREASLAAVDADVAAARSDVVDRIDEAATDTIEVASEAFTDIDAEARETARVAEAGAQSSLDEATADFAGTIEGALAELDTELAEKVARAREAARLVVERAALARGGGAFAWLRRQLGQLWHSIASWGFLAALAAGIVGVAIFPAELVGLAFVGVAAVIGAFASAIGRLVSNILAGRSWFDGLGEAFVSGAAFGAALAAVGLWVEEGAAAVAAAMATAGAVTVVENLLAGRPWDDDLLGNAILAGASETIAEAKNDRDGGVAAEDRPTPEQPSRPPLDFNVGIPSELVSLYESLSPKAQAQLEYKWAAIRGTRGETPATVAVLKSALDSVARGANGDLQAGLEAQWDRANPVQNAHGPAAGHLPALRELLDVLAEEIEAERLKTPGRGYEQLAKRLVDESRQPLEGLEHGDEEATVETVNGIRASLDGIQGELETAKVERSVIGLGRMKHGAGRSVEIDVIADGGRRWIEVKNVNPFGTGSTACEALFKQVDDRIIVARDPRNALPDGTAPTVVVRFPRGMGRDVVRELRAKGAEVLLGKGPSRVLTPSLVRGGPERGDDG